MRERERERKFNVDSLLRQKILFSIFRVLLLPLLSLHVHIHHNTINTSTPNTVHWL